MAALWSFLSIWLHGVLGSPTPRCTRRILLLLPLGHVTHSGQMVVISSDMCHCRAITLNSNTLYQPPTESSTMEVCVEMEVPQGGSSSNPWKESPTPTADIRWLKNTHQRACFPSHSTHRKQGKAKWGHSKKTVVCNPRTSLCIRYQPC